MAWALLHQSVYTRVCVCVSSLPPSLPARYHLHDDRPMAELLRIVPGQPSPALRRALGLSESAPPPYLVRMRDLGYPPGWTRAAVLRLARPSGLVIHGENATGGDPIVVEKGFFVWHTMSFIFEAIYLCICMYVCVYVCMYVYVCMCVCVYV